MTFAQGGSRPASSKRAPETLADDVAIAARRARVERRPIVLNVPVDFQDAAVEAMSGRRGPVLVDVALDPATIPDPGRH